jgi:hypothetical protein
VRVFAVVLGVIYTLAYGIPTVLYLNGYYGNTGIVKAGALATLPRGADVNTVGQVVPGSPAARAAIVPGDVVVQTQAEGAPGFEQIFDRVAAGHPVAYTVVHEGRRREVMLTPRPVRPTPVDATLIVTQLLRGIAIVLIGALIVLLRPSFMTAAFFVLCLEFGELAHPTGNLELVNAVPLFWKPLFLALTCIVNGSGPAFAAVFCMRFPSGAPLPAWRRTERWMLAAGAFTIVVYLSALAAAGTFTWLGGLLYGIESAAAWLGYAVATAAFMVRYVHASGEDRDRLRWVAIGLGSFLLSYALFWISQNVASAPWELSTWAQFINVLPLAVLYAIVRHRVLDVRIIGGRALAYAVLSAVPVIAFSLIDLVVSNQLQQTRLALVAEVAVALGFGFWVNASQKRIDTLIETVFFHARRAAEVRLRKVARRIGHATERGVVDETLVREPFEALQVTGVALYALAGGVYRRSAGRGWQDDVLPEVGENDTLALELIATRETVFVDAIAWETARTLRAVRGALAFPVVVRGNVLGLLLLGEKRSGERFDELERAAVETLVAAAANTYDHLDAVEQQRIADGLRRLLDLAEAENETLRALLGREASGV